MLRPLAVSLVVAGMAVLLLASCGASGGGASSTSTPTPGSTAAIEGGGAQRLPTVPKPSKQVSPTPSAALSQQQFAAQVFNDVQAMWSREFAKAGIRYRPARLVEYSSVVHTSCGTQPSDVGPFYCPADGTVYLDLTFLTAPQQHIGATGDFARAYIIAHELGHHVQNLLGISSRAATVEQHDPAAANAVSVRVELQADCLADVWAHSTYDRKLLEPGDLEQALKAAAAVGDDFQQRLSGGQVEPESWSHGSSAQRQQWLQTGFHTGSPGSCDTLPPAAA
ncbi:MAG: KPN_02809 family neutral zinc metallopeptidase [Candidatus Dormibacteraceae bacterium]